MAESFNERVAYWLRKQRMLPAAEIGVIAEGPNSLVPWQFLRVELKCLNPDGTADAYRLEWDEEEEEYAVDTSVSASELIKVRPFDGGKIGGVGKDDVSEGQNGTRLWVIHPFDRGDNTPADDTWEPLGAAARGRYRGDVYTSTVAKTDATFQVDNTHPLDGGPDLSDFEPITVSNWAKWEAQADMPVLIEWDAVEKTWVFVQGPCKGDYA